MATADQVPLLANGSATGSAQKWMGGRGVFLAEFTGTGVVALQYQNPITLNWLTVGTAATLSATGMAGFELPPGNIRAAVISGTPTAIYATAIGTRTA